MHSMYSKKLLKKLFKIMTYSILSNVANPISLEGHSRITRRHSNGTQKALEEHLKVLTHSKGFPRAFEHSKGTWTFKALDGLEHSKGT